MWPDKSENTADFWKKALASCLASLREEALQNNGVIAPAGVRQAKDLNTLLRIEKALSPTSPSPRWPLALAFVCTLLALSVLFFRHVSSTRIDLNATISQISWVDALTRFPLPVILSRVAIDGVTLDQQNAWDCKVSPGVPSAFTFQTVGTATGHNAISVSPLDLPQGTLVTLTHTGIAFRQDLRLTFPSSDNDHPIVMTAVGNAHLKGGGCDATSTASPFDHLTFHTAARQTLDLSLDSLAEDLPMPIDVPASKVTFFNVEISSTPKAEYAKELSTIYSGSLFFDSVGGRERKLREGERIEMSGFRGSVHMLHAQKDRLRARLTGEVSDVRSGESSSTLKPTYFEYLTVNQGLPSLWGAVVYCFGLTIVVMKWWKADA